MPFRELQCVLLSKIDPLSYLRARVTERAREQEQKKDLAVCRSGLLGLSHPSSTKIGSFFWFAREKKVCKIAAKTKSSQKTQTLGKILGKVQNPEYHFPSATLDRTRADLPILFQIQIHYEPHYEPFPIMVRATLEISELLAMLESLLNTKRLFFFIFYDYRLCEHRRQP